MKYLNKLVSVKTEKRNIFQIIIWWEIRRILYNIIVLIAGILSIIIMTKTASGRVQLEAGEDLCEPIMIPIFAILCNIGYTLGWITELFIKPTITYGPKMFKIGFYFTLFWVFLPATIWALTALTDCITNIF